MTIISRFGSPRKFDDTKKDCIVSFNGSRNIAKSLVFQKWALVDDCKFDTQSSKLKQCISNVVENCAKLFVIDLDSIAKEEICKSCFLEAQNIVRFNPKISKKEFAQKLYYYMQALVLESKSL